VQLEARNSWLNSGTSATFRTNRKPAGLSWRVFSRFYRGMSYSTAMVQSLSSGR
jgi:hypothetical protein